MTNHPKSDALMSLILEYRYASKSEDAFAAKEALIAGLHRLEERAAYWERMYVCAQNANSFRQDAIDEQG